MTGSAVVASLMGVLLIAACGRASDSSGTTEATETLRTSEAPVATQLSSGSTTSTDAGGEAPATTPPSSGSTTSTESRGSGLVELELTVFDWTNNVPPPEDAFVVVEGVESWTPDLEFGGDVHLFGGFTIGVPGILIVYPDGHSGSEIEVTFVMTDEMISGSDMAMTHVEIYDSEVLVWGIAIPGFEQTFDR